MNKSVVDFSAYILYKFTSLGRYMGNNYYSEYAYSSRNKLYAAQNAYVSTNISHLHSVSDLHSAFEKLSPEGGTVHLKISSIPGAELGERDALALAHKAVELADKAGNVRVVLRVREKGFEALTELDPGFSRRFQPALKQRSAQSAIGS